MHRVFLALGILSVILAACGGGNAPARSSPAIATAAAVYLTPSPDPEVAFPPPLPQYGQIRVALPTSEQGVFSKDPATGELKGALLDATRELARRAGLYLVIVEYAGYPKLVELMKAEKFDIAALNHDPARDSDLDFGPPLIDVDFAYLVRPGVSIKTAADVDRPGVRVIVRRGNPPDQILTPILKKAEFVRMDGLQDDAFGALAAGRGDVLALVRPAVVAYSQKLPGSVVLSERFGLAQFAFAVPKGQRDVLAPVTRFSDQIRSNGSMAQWIERSGPAGTKATAP